MEPNQETPPINQPTTPSNPSTMVNPEIKPKKSHKLLFILLGVFIALILVGGIGGGYFLNKSNEVKSPPQNVVKETKIDNTDTPTPSPTPKKILKSEELYTLNLPEGWKKEEEIFTESLNFLYVSYSNDVGDFLIAEINDPGKDPGFDEIWRFKPNSSNDGIIIVDKKQCDESTSLYCLTEDNKMTIIIFPYNWEGPKLKGNIYSFQAGNKNRDTGIDTGIYKNIVESIKIM